MCFDIQMFINHCAFVSVNSLAVSCILSIPTTTTTITTTSNSTQTLGLALICTSKNHTISLT